MFAARYFAPRYFAPRYFPEGSGGTSTPTDPFYWRGALWVGQPKIAWPIDGALR